MNVCEMLTVENMKTIELAYVAIKIRNISFGAVGALVKRFRINDSLSPCNQIRALNTPDDLIVQIKVVQM